MRIGWAPCLLLLCVATGAIATPSTGALAHSRVHDARFREIHRHTGKTTRGQLTARTRRHFRLAKVRHAYGHSRDTTPPDTTIISGPSGTISSSDAAFGFTSSEARSTFQCRLDGAAWSSCHSPDSLSALADGTQVFDVRATDAAGNIDPTPASRSFSVQTVSLPPPPDTTPPDTTITSGPSGTISSSDAAFGFTSSEAGSTFQCRLDGAAWSSCSSPTALSALADGAHVFDVRAIDAAGNIDPTPASLSFTVSTGLPGYPSLAHIDWDGDFDSGCELVGSFSGAWDVNATNADHVGGLTTIERSIVGEGQCAAKFTDAASTTMVRSELARHATGPDPEFTYEMLVYVPSGQSFPKGSTLTQTKEDGSAGGCYNGGWQIADNTGTTGGRLQLRTVFACTTPQVNGQRNFDAGPLPRDRWFALKVHERFSNDPRVGFIQAWVDADGTGPGGYAEVVPRTFLDNEDAGGEHVRMRIGSYRQATSHTTTLYIDGFHMECVSNC